MIANTLNKREVLQGVKNRCKEGDPYSYNAEYLKNATDCAILHLFLI